MKRGDLLVTRWGARLGARWLPCAVGRGGIVAAKREGDGATPAGGLHLTGLRYRADRVARPALPCPDLPRPGPARRARPIGPADLWSDDLRDPAYNTAVRAPHAFSHERLRRADRLYDILVETDWNAAPARPGRGSAIFVHVWRAPRMATAGCIAFSRADLRWLLRRLGPRAAIEVRATGAGRAYAARCATSRSMNAAPARNCVRETYSSG